MFLVFPFRHPLIVVAQFEAELAANVADNEVDRAAFATRAVYVTFRIARRASSHSCSFLARDASARLVASGNTRRACTSLSSTRLFPFQASRARDVLRLDRLLDYATRLYDAGCRVLLRVDDETLKRVDFAVVEQVFAFRISSHARIHSICRRSSR